MPWPESHTPMKGLERWRMGILASFTKNSEGPRSTQDLQGSVEACMVTTCQYSSSLCLVPGAYSLTAVDLKGTPSLQLSTSRHQTQEASQ